MTIAEYNHSVRKMSDDLYRFALRYCGIGSDAEDAVQDVFVTLWEQHERVEAAKVKGYLIRLLYRRLVDMHRHNEVVRRALSGEGRTESEGRRTEMAFELHDALNQALGQLPEQQRALVLLRDLEGYEYGEMAAMTGLSEQQVGVYLYRARKTLKKLLSDYR